MVVDSLQKLHLVLNNDSYYVLFCNKAFSFNLSNNLFFTNVLDNLCQNALDLSNSKLIVDNNWPLGTYCQWLISAEDENSYIAIEFQNINVS